MPFLDHLEAIGQKVKCHTHPTRFMLESVRMPLVSAHAMHGGFFMSREQMSPMSILEATARYEAWLERQHKPVKSGLARKHARMSDGSYAFFQATYYRFAERLPQLCPELWQATQLPSVGNLHIENFGTWRDREGRLVWGVMELEQAWKLPWTQDLVRLGTSVALAIDEKLLSADTSAALQALLEGYEQGLIAHGKPFVLDGEHPDLQALLSGTERTPTHFWQQLKALPELTRLPESAVKALNRLLPREELDFKLLSGENPLESLGQASFVVLGEYRGGLIAREARAVAPSAFAWLEKRSGDAQLRRELGKGAVRSPDPLLRLGRKWQIRRISPECGPLSLKSLQSSTELLSVLRAMGTEAANIHLNSRKSRGIREELARLEPGWLAHAVRVMGAAVKEDLDAWREGFVSEIEKAPAPKEKAQAGKPSEKKGKKS